MGFRCHMITDLVAFGDSWTYGSELYDPMVQENFGDFDSRNDAYRLAHAWPARLANRLGVRSVVNLGTPARSNDTICRDLRTWLASQGFLTGRDCSRHMICIGWTSPERRDFYFKSSDAPRNPDQGWMTMYPLWSHDYAHPALNQFSRLYVEHFWHAEEYMQRWIWQLLDTQHLLTHLGFKWIMFQAFYQHHHKLIAEWDDATYADRSDMSPHLVTTWRSLDADRFMHRDEQKHTFHNHISGGARMFNGNHPSELGHDAWAEHMASWIEAKRLACA